MAADPENPERIPNRPRGPYSGGGGWWWVFAILVIIGIGIWWIWGWGVGSRGYTGYPANDTNVTGGAAENQPNPAQLAPGGATAPTVATVADILSGQMTGREVSVRAQVGEILGPKELTLREKNGATQSSDLLIISTVALPEKPGQKGNEPLLSGDTIIVTGQVRNFNIDQFSRDYGVTLPTGAFGGWAGKPAVAARSITFASSGLAE